MAACVRARFAHFGIIIVDMNHSQLHNKLCHAFLLGSRLLHLSQPSSQRVSHE